LKIKLDENLPNQLGLHLASLGHDVETVHDEGLKGRDDPTIWGAAQREGRFLITQDLDFSDARKFVPGTHHGLLLVRLSDPGRLALAAHVRKVFESQPVDGWSGCIVVVTERKLRVLRPPESLEHPRA
jgi:predicted nuclease of predicted toxin-antitoxin system